MWPAVLEPPKVRSAMSDELGLGWSEVDNAQDDASRWGLTALGAAWLENSGPDKTELGGVRGEMSGRAGSIAADVACLSATHPLV